MPKRNENVKRLLEFCDVHDIDLSDIQTAQEEVRGHEMDSRLKLYATVVAIASTLLVGAWRLFSTESIAQQAHIENQAQTVRLQAMEQTVSQQSVQIAVQSTQYQNIVGQLSTLQSQQNEVIRSLKESRKK